MKCPPDCTCGRHSQATRDKMSKAHTGTPVSEDARAKISAAKLGVKCPDGCTCGKHVKGTSRSKPCPDGCTCGRHKARLPEGSEFAALKHGLRNTPEYQSWAGMKQRCYNPAVEHYDRYGGRGITICAHWRNSFENFYADMGPRPEPKSAYSIDRKDNSGGYWCGHCAECTANGRPANGKWSTKSEQAQNRG